MDFYCANFHCGCSCRTHSMVAVLEETMVISVVARTFYAEWRKIVFEVGIVYKT